MNKQMSRETNTAITFLATVKQIFDSQAETDIKIDALYAAVRFYEDHVKSDILLRISKIQEESNESLELVFGVAGLEIAENAKRSLERLRTMMSMDCFKS